MQNFSFQNIEILNKFQRYLYGHDDLFINLTSLFEKKKLPNKIIFNGEIFWLSTDFMNKVKI